MLYMSVCLSVSLSERESKSLWLSHTDTRLIGFRIKNIKIHTEVMTEVEQDFTFSDDRRLACVFLNIDKCKCVCVLTVTGSFISDRIWPKSRELYCNGTPLVQTLPEPNAVINWGIQLGLPWYVVTTVTAWCLFTLFSHAFCLNHYQRQDFSLKTHILGPVIITLRDPNQ